MIIRVFTSPTDLMDDEIGEMKNLLTNWFILFYTIDMNIVLMIQSKEERFRTMKPNKTNLILICELKKTVLLLKQPHHYLLASQTQITFEFPVVH